MADCLKLLRYNTGSDKKAFIDFRNDFDAVLFNASIVAYNGAAISDIISLYMKKYIIDPQTYILQHNIEAFLSKQGTIKASVDKYLNQLPSNIKSIITEEHRELNITDIRSILDNLVECVYEFQLNYIDSFLKDKEYNKYIQYKLEKENTTKEYSPQLIIAPYFRLKKQYNNLELDSWLQLNRDSLERFLSISKGSIPIATELLLDKDILCRINPAQLKEIYNLPGYEYVILWVDDFSPLEAKNTEQQGFKSILSVFNSLGKKVIMAYGGYDSIILCHSQSKIKLFGVAQSVGYGESRPITPVGGGLPVNKYYFYPLHRRLSFGDASSILSKLGYFTTDKNKKKIFTSKFYSEICNCPQCQEIICDDIDNFKKYNDSVPYNWKGDIKRNRPTTEASLIAARHFMFCKKKEWDSLDTPLTDIIEKLLRDFNLYTTTKDLQKLRNFINIYVE